MTRILTLLLVLSLAAGIIFFVVLPLFKVRGISDVEIERRSGGYITKSTKVSFNVSNETFKKFPKDISAYKISNPKDKSKAVSLAAKVGVDPKTLDRNPIIGESPKNVLFDESSGRFAFYNDKPLLNYGFVDSQKDLENKAKNQLISLGIAPDIVIRDSHFFTKPDSLGAQNVVSSNDPNAALFTLRFRRSLNGLPVIYEESPNFIATFNNNFDLVNLDFYINREETAQPKKRLKNLKDIQKQVKNYDFAILYTSATSKDQLTVDVNGIQYKEINLNSIYLAYLKSLKNPDLLLPIFTLTGEAKNKAGKTIPITVYVPAQK